MSLGTRRASKLSRTQPPHPPSSNEGRQQRRWGKEGCGWWERVGMSGYLVAEQMMQCKYICACIKKCINLLLAFPSASHVAPPSCSGLCKRAHCSLGSWGQPLSVEKATIHLSSLLSLCPDALQNKQATSPRIIARARYQTTSAESLTVWGSEIQQGLARLPVSLLLDLCFQMETIWSS